MPLYEINSNFNSFIKNYAATHLKTYPVKIEENTHIILCETELNPTRMISIYFPDDQKPKIFHLFEIEQMNEESGSFGMRLDYEGVGEPVDVNTFNNWVEGSRNQYLAERLRVLETDLLLTSNTNSRFLTSSKTSKELASLMIGGGGDSGNYSPLINIDLPYFDSVTEKSLAKARKNEVAFTEFRSAFSKALVEIDSATIGLSRNRIDEIIGDIVLTPVAKVESRMKALRRNLFLDAIMLVGTLTTSVIAEPITASAALLLAGKAVANYKTNKAEEDKIRESIGYFYWQAKRR